MCSRYTTKTLSVNAVGFLSLPISGLPEAGEQLNLPDACKMMSEEARPYFRAGIGELLPV